MPLKVFIRFSNFCKDLIFFAMRKSSGVFVCVNIRQYRTLMIPICSKKLNDFFLSFRVLLKSTRGMKIDTFCLQTCSFAIFHRKFSISGFCNFYTTWWERFYGRLTTKELICDCNNFPCGIHLEIMCLLIFATFRFQRKSEMIFFLLLMNHMLHTLTN